MKIRLFRKEDSTQLISLINEFLEYTTKSYSKQALEFAKFKPSKKHAYSKNILKYFSELHHSRFLVAVEGTKIIGYVMGAIESNPHVIKSKAGSIKSFFVTKEFRGKGIGKQLNKALVEWFKKKKCDHLELDVYDGNKKTISMYKKWGFKEVLIKLKKKI